MGVLKQMDKTGDTQISWEKDKPEEVEVAKGVFNQLKKKGYLAWKVGKDDKKGEVIKEFDPNAEKIILAPRMVGG